MLFVVSQLNVIEGEVNFLLLHPHLKCDPMRSDVSRSISLINITVPSNSDRPPYSVDCLLRRLFLWTEPFRYYQVGQREARCDIFPRATSLAPPPPRDPFDCRVKTGLFASRCRRQDWQSHTSREPDRATSKPAPWRQSRMMG